MFFHFNIFACVHFCDECKRSKSAKRVSQAFVHFAIARASLFTDHKISGLPIRAKYKYFITMCEQTVDNSLTDPISSSFQKLMVIHARCRDLVQLLSCFICKFALSFHAFLRMTFHVIRPRRSCFGIKFHHGFGLW